MNRHTASSGTPGRTVGLSEGLLGGRGDSSQGWRELERGQEGPCVLAELRSLDSILSITCVQGRGHGARPDGDFREYVLPQRRASLQVESRAAGEEGVAILPERGRFVHSGSLVNEHSC